MIKYLQEQKSEHIAGIDITITKIPPKIDNIIVKTRNYEKLVLVIGIVSLFILFLALYIKLC